MNSKVTLFSLLVGTIALSASMTSVIPAFAQSTNSAPRTERNQMRRPDFLNLTAEQQARMEQIRQNERSQIDAILTAEQKAQLQSDRANRQPRTEENSRPPMGENGRPSAGMGQQMFRSPFASLNLTSEQQSQIEAVRRSSREQMDAVLTAEQRQQLQQRQQQHQQRRQGNSQAPQNR